MSTLSLDELKKISRLSKISITEEKELAGQIGSIVDWFSCLQEINTDKIQPLTNVHEMLLRLNPDEIKDGNILDDLFKNTESKYNYFIVPKVIE